MGEGYAVVEVDDRIVVVLAVASFQPSHEGLECGVVVAVLQLHEGVDASSVGGSGNAAFLGLLGVGMHDEVVVERDACRKPFLFSRAYGVVADQYFLSGNNGTHTETGNFLHSAYNALGGRLFTGGSFVGIYHRKGNRMGGICFGMCGKE